MFKVFLLIILLFIAYPLPYVVLLGGLVRLGFGFYSSRPLLLASMALALPQLYLFFSHATRGLDFGIGTVFSLAAGILFVVANRSTNALFYLIEAGFCLITIFILLARINWIVG